jgi:hypothetical protein
MKRKEKSPLIHFMKILNKIRKTTKSFLIYITNALTELQKPQKFILKKNAQRNPNKSIKFLMNQAESQ